MKISRTPQRSSDQVSFSISMPIALRDKIDKMAKAEHRTRSNWIVARLESAILEIEEAALPQAEENRVK